MTDELEFGDFFWDRMQSGNQDADNTIVDKSTLTEGWMTYASLDFVGLDPVVGLLQAGSEEARDNGDTGD